MELLGKLGVDIKLLIAQIVNFSLLVFILAKFLYKPIIKRIEADEEELNKARIENERLAREKEELAELRKKEIATAKKQSKRIIKEAEAIAQDIKIRSQEKADFARQQVQVQNKRLAELQIAEMKTQILTTAKEEIRQALTKNFRQAFSPALQKEWQNLFWLDFQQQLKSLSLKRKIKLKINKKNHNSQKKTSKIISAKLGPVILEYVYPLTKSQQKFLTDFLVKKTGYPLNITWRQNKELINGFRLEIMGFVIESNLLNIIKNATVCKK